MKHLKFPYLIIAIAVLFSACTGKSGDGENIGDGDSTKTNVEDGKLVQLGGNKLFSIPSPIQTAFLIQSSGAAYNKSLLNNTASASKYSTDIQKSLNLGVYGADLAYINLYEQTQDAISYLNSCKKLADDLGVMNAFTPAFQKKFEKNLGNKDSLLGIVSDAYKSIDVYLQKNQNNDVGSMILAGGWIEALYFSTNVYKTNPTNELKKRIGEQKFSIINLIKLLETYSNNGDIDEVINPLRDLSDSFEKVEISYEYAKPEVLKDKKMSIIKSKTEIKISDELIKEITQKISTLRNNIIS